MEIQDSEDDAEPVEVLAAEEEKTGVPAVPAGCWSAFLCCQYAICAVLVSAEAEIYVPAHFPHPRMKLNPGAP